MIKVKKLAPQVYYDTSRDFQLLGRSLDVVFNYLKTNSNIINGLPLSENSDRGLLDLLSLTLGFKSKHNYNSNQLFTICSCFSEILKNKGNLLSIEKSINALLQAEGIKEASTIILPKDSYSPLEIYLPKELKDFNLLIDLFDYILPAGMSCKIVRVPSQQKAVDTEVKSSNSLEWGSKDMWSTSFIPQYKEDVTSSEITDENAGGRIDNSLIIPRKETGE